MRMSKISLNSEQQTFLADNGIDYDYANMSVDDMSDLVDKVSEILALKGFDEQYEVNELGRQAESVITVVTAHPDW